MTVRRGSLYTGVFLLATGGVVLLAQAGAIDSEAVTRALSLWPLAIIAIGIGLILRRTRIGLAGGMVAAAMPGLLFGGMIVAVPDLPDVAGWSGPCGGASRTEAVTERHGSFGAAARVDLSLACGELIVTSGAGSLRVCAPADLGLRVRGESSLGSTTYIGLVRVGDAWESPDYTTKPFHADLTVEANVGSVVINPEGGCL